MKKLEFARPRGTPLLLALVWSALLAGALVQPACARQAEPDAAETLLRTGRYDDAVAAYRAAVARDGSASAHRGLVQALLEVGRLDEAEQAARAGAARHEVALARTLGDVLYARGDRTGADAAYRAAVAGNAEDALLARYRRGVLMRERGERAAAEAEFDVILDGYAGGRLNAAGLLAVGESARLLGETEPRLYHDALRVLDEAAAADAAWHTPRIRLGDLFLAAYNSADAQQEYEAVLRVNPSHPEALLGMAKAKFFDGSPEAAALVETALEINPNLVPARVFLARLRLAREDFDGASEELQRALAVDAAHPEALAVTGAAAYLRGDRREYDAIRERALARNAADADFFATVAELAVLHRRYQDAVTLAEEAVARDADSARAWSVLGMNRMRVGQVEGAKAALDRAFEGDPYNVWVKNTLDLLDTYPQYVTVSTRRFEFFLHRDEAELLAPYMEALAEEAYDVLAERYGVRPAPPIRIEVFPRSADFSVRTLGLTGLGALGVAFGSNLVMDSPAARDIGAFNWASTMWHEIAHTFTLEASRNRVPRWLTEGLSVLEERRAREGWGFSPSLGFLAAYKQGRLLPVSRLNRGFTSPDFPEMVQYSYYQASLVAEMIERDHGMDAIRRMLRAHGEGRDADTVLREVLRTDAAAFDARFDRYMQERFGSQLAAIRVERVAGAAGAAGAAGGGQQGGGAAARRIESADPGDYVANVVVGHRRLQEGALEEAVRHLERAAQLFPEHGGPDGAWRFLAEAHRGRGDAVGEMRALEGLTATAEADYLANTRLAELRREAGDARGEMAALERAVWISPYDPELHVRLAELYTQHGDHAGAVRERKAVVALRPVDRAQALYALAVAELAAGDSGAARRSVLRALEIAPSFEAAQELLLRIAGGG